MAHFACISLPHYGHLNPMAVLARALARRGHRVTFFHMADVGPRIRRLGLNFVPVGASTHPPGWLEPATARLGEVGWLRGLSPILRDLAGVTAMLCEELPACMRAHGVDVVLADQIEAAGGMVAYRLGLPFISLAAMLPLNWEEGVPSPFVGWSYGATRWHRCRNIASAFGAKTAMRPVGDVIESFASRWGIRRGRQIEHYMSGFAQVSQLTPSIDFPRRSLIGCFHYCGPLRETQPAASNKPRRRTGRAFASLGTLQGHRIALFDQILQATKACGLDLTIAHGGRLNRTEAAYLSRYAYVTDFVCHDDIFGDVDVAITHGGMNTVLDALAWRVPLVVTPLAFEQRAIAARIARSGAGRICTSRRVRPFADAIADVAGRDTYATAAGRIADEIRTAGGVSRAADIIEYVAQTGRPYLNAEALAREQATTADVMLAPRSTSAGRAQAAG